MHFIGQNRKKWRKRTQLIFQFYMEIGPPTFLGGPLGGENDIIFKISHRKKLWQPSTAHKLTQEPFSIVRLLMTKKKSTPCFRLSVETCHSSDQKCRHQTFVPQIIDRVLSGHHDHQQEPQPRPADHQQLQQGHDRWDGGEDPHIKNEDNVVSC